MNLFEIDEQLQRCIKLEASDNFVDTETGEIIDVAAIEQLEMDRDKKIRNIACWIRNLEADEKALADQIKTFTTRKNAAKNKRESLKSYLANFLNGAKWQNSEVAISWRKSESVEVEEGAAIPEKYLRYKEPEINKAAIKTDLKAGASIYGCQLVTKNNIQIK